jgi:hypothetical protein
MLWTLYNSDGDQAGSYFGAQKANRSLHAIYALDAGTVTLDNLGNTTQAGLTVEAKVYNLAGTVLDDQTASNITLTSQQVRTGALTPRVPTSIPAQVYFVELQLRQNGTLVDRNVYWLSTQPDVVNWKKSLGQPQGTLPIREPHQLADVAGLVGLGHRQHRQPGGAGRRGPGHHRHHHQHVLGHGRVPAPGGRAARHRRRPGTVRRQRTAVLAVARTTTSAVPRRVADAHRHLELR